MELCNPKKSQCFSVRNFGFSALVLLCLFLGNFSFAQQSNLGITVSDYDVELDGDDLYVSYTISNTSGSGETVVIWKDWANAGYPHCVQSIWLENRDVVGITRFKCRRLTMVDFWKYQAEHTMGWGLARDFEGLFLNSKKIIRKPRAKD